MSVRQLFGGTIVALAMMLFNSVAIARERSEKQCHQLHPEIESPVEYAHCIHDSVSAQRSVQSAYMALISMISDEYRPLLEKSQQDWAAYRDAQCSYEAEGYLGNTAHDADIIACVAEMNRDRTKYLLKEKHERWAD